MKLASTIVGLGLILSLGAAQSRADMSTYYVGLDTAAGVNQGHLTFLLNHGNHFHRLGVFGGAEGRIPEGYVGGALAMRAGQGALAGRFVSGEDHIDGDPTAEYSDLEVRSIATIAGFPDGTPEATLANGGLRYFGDLSQSLIALELVSMSDGLNIGDASGNTWLTSAGDRRVLGIGDSFAAFTPTFFTEMGSPGGATYEAVFRLVDLNGRAGDSGTFRYVLAAVPEPASVAMMGLGLSAVSAFAAKRRESPQVPSATTSRLRRVTMGRRLIS